MQWDFTTILVPDCCHEQSDILQLLVFLKMSLELRIQLKDNQSRLEKRHSDCADQSNILLGMLAICQGL